MGFNGSFVEDEEEEFADMVNALSLNLVLN